MSMPHRKRRVDLHPRFIGGSGLESVSPAMHAPAELISSMS
jgi:hypothetical protein